MHLVYIVLSQMLMMIDDLRTGGVFCRNNPSKFLVLVKSTKLGGKLYFCYNPFIDCCCST